MERYQFEERYRETAHHRDSFADRVISRIFNLFYRRDVEASTCDGRKRLNNRVCITSANFTEKMG